MMTLWSMARSPLILGANLTLMDDETFQLITNKELLRIDQTATASREVLRLADDLVVWTADLPNGERALAVFNRGEMPARMEKPLTAFGLGAGAWHGSDVWQPQGEPLMQGIDRTIAPHGCVLLLLRR